ncbi:MULTISPECIES: H-NS histone family protein [Cupriavidus]
MPSYKELLAEKQKLEAQLASVRAQEVAGVIEQIRQLMADYDLSVEDIAHRRRGRPASGVKQAPSEVPPKYRDPKTGKTWSGRGRAPAWLGKNRNRFLIEAPEA